MMTLAQRRPLARFAGLAATIDEPALREVIPRLLDEANAVAQSCIPEVKRVTRTGPAPEHKPSILQDYELGRAMEIDVLVRAPAAFARAANLSTPMLDLLADREVS